MITLEGRLPKPSASIFKNIDSVRQSHFSTVYLALERRILKMTQLLNLHNYQLLDVIMTNLTHSMLWTSHSTTQPQVPTQHPKLCEH